MVITSDQNVVTVRKINGINDSGGEGWRKGHTLGNGTTQRGGWLLLHAIAIIGQAHARPCIARKGTITLAFERFGSRGKKFSRRRCITFFVIVYIILCFG